MSVLSSHDQIVAPAGLSGKAAIDDLYVKWTVTAAVFG